MLELEHKCKAIVEREKERRELELQRHEEEVARNVAQNERLKASLESLLSTPKK